jgi:YggT family protein
MVYLANIVRLIFSIYIILIFIRILFVWLRPNMFNPIVRFVYRLTDPYLKLFAGLRFLRIGALDFSPILAFYVLYLAQELCYNVILRGHITPEFLASLTITLCFRFVYFILFIFIVALALRFIFGLVRMGGSNVLATAVYSISEPAVRPFRNLLRIRHEGGVDVAALLALIIFVLARFLILPRLLKLIIALISNRGF